MVTLYIADDEKMVIDGLLRISWADYRVQVAGYAMDGEKAVHDILQLRPDIVLIDIKMPKCSGLNVIEKVRETNQDTYFVIYSAYSDFDYARRAMQLGTVNYLVKPSRKQQIVEEICKIAGIIKEKRGMRQIGAGQLSAGQNTEMIKLVVRNLKKRGYQYAIVRKNEPMQESFGEAGTLIDAYTVLFGCMEEELSDIPVPFGYIDLSACDNLEIFSLMPAALNQAYFYGIRIKIDMDFGKNMLPENFFDYHKYLNCMEGQDIDSIISENFEKERWTGVRPVDVKYFFINGIYELAAELEKKYGYGVWGSLCEKNEFFENVIRQEKYELLADYAAQFVKDICAFYQSRNMNKADQFIGKTVNYITEHLNEDISLSVLGNYVNLAPAYLSNLFKNHTGKTITKYILEERINKAMYLLRYTDMKINKISEAVGYGDHKYFCQVFKKYTGSSASEYRKNHGTIIG